MQPAPRPVLCSLTAESEQAQGVTHHFVNRYIVDKRNAVIAGVKARYSTDVAGA